MTRSITVSAERPYTVEVGAGVSDSLDRLVHGADQVAILHPAVMRERAERLCAPLGAHTTLIEVPDAEQAKTAGVLAQCWDRLAEAGFTRSDAVVGFGGGATTDLAGFVAASWLRGVRLVTVPTTVLGMVDAAVGGKTGINIPAGKNLVGAFWEPAGVLCDLDLLATLPTAEIRAGMAEVVKCGFIADPQILDLIEQDPADALEVTSSRLAELIARGIEVKARVVSTDLREATSTGTKVGRELLNYGHTLGHAIERHHDYTWRHGEAISVGMVFVAEVARQLGALDEPTATRHRGVLELLDLPTRYDGPWPALRATMNLDKKTRGSRLRLVILNGLASAEICGDPPEEVLAQAYASLA